MDSVGMLDKKLAEVPVGSLVDITYTGTSIIESGDWKGELAHQFDVSFENAAVTETAEVKSPF